MFSRRPTTELFEGGVHRNSFNPLDIGSIELCSLTVGNATSPALPSTTSPQVEVHIDTGGNTGGSTDEAVTGYANNPMNAIEN